MAVALAPRAPSTMSDRKTILVSLREYNRWCWRVRIHAKTGFRQSPDAGDRYERMLDDGEQAERTPPGTRKGRA